MTFAPTVDMNSNADNPVIGVRSFGAVAEQVATHSAAWIAGLQSTGVGATAKHFPGHGDTGQDSHVALPVIDRSLDELRRRELLPFVAAIETGYALDHDLAHHAASAGRRESGDHEPVAS